MCRVALHAAAQHRPHTRFPPSLYRARKLRGAMRGEKSKDGSESKSSVARSQRSSSRGSASSVSAGPAVASVTPASASPLTKTKDTPPARTTRSRAVVKEPQSTEQRQRSTHASPVASAVEDDESEESTVDPTKLRVVDLRKELQSRGLSTKGLKKVLVMRLTRALEDAAAKRIQNKSAVPEEQHMVEPEETASAQGGAPPNAPAVRNAVGLRVDVDAGGKKVGSDGPSPKRRRSPRLREQEEKQEQKQEAHKHAKVNPVTTLGAESTVQGQKSKDHAVDSTSTSGVKRKTSPNASGRKSSNASADTDSSSAMNSATSSAEEKLYRRKLKSLIAMGFINEPMILDALRESKGILYKAVSILNKRQSSNSFNKSKPSSASVVKEIEPQNVPEPRPVAVRNHNPKPVTKPPSFGPGKLWSPPNKRQKIGAPSRVEREAPLSDIGPSPPPPSGAAPKAAGSFLSKVTSGLKSMLWGGAKKVPSKAAALRKTDVKSRIFQKPSSSRNGRAARAAQPTRAGHKRKNSPIAAAEAGPSGKRHSSHESLASARSVSSTSSVRLQPTSGTDQGLRRPATAVQRSASRVKSKRRSPARPVTSALGETAPKSRLMRPTNIQASANAKQLREAKKKEWMSRAAEKKRQAEEEKTKRREKRKRRQAEAEKRRKDLKDKEELRRRRRKALLQKKKKLRAAAADASSRPLAPPTKPPVAPKKFTPRSGASSSIAENRLDAMSPPAPRPAESKHWAKSREGLIVQAQTSQSRPGTSMPSAASSSRSRYTTPPNKYPKNYDIPTEKSDSDASDCSPDKNRIPLWAQSPHLKRRLESQVHIDADKIFGYVAHIKPDLAEIFRGFRSRRAIKQREFVRSPPRARAQCMSTWRPF